MMNTMNDADLKRNGSGYYDEPCYKAITAPPKAGEIWTHSNSGAYMLVLANAGGVCSTLRLTETEREGSISVMCKTPMYVTPIMLGYTFENLLAQYVKSVKGEEFMAVQQAVGKALGLADAAARDEFTTKENEALEGKLEAQVAQNMYLRTENKSLKAQLEEAKAPKTESDEMKAMKKEYNEAITCKQQEIIKLTIYKDMYMDMYMDIIGKLVSMRGGAVVND